MTEKIEIDQDLLMSIISDFNRRIEPVRWQMNSSFALAYFLLQNFDISPKSDEILFPGLRDLIAAYSDHKERCKK